MVKLIARIASSACLATAALSIIAASADAKRVALVVGNNTYQALTPLKKAVNDSRAVKAALEELGFAVIQGEDLSRRQMNERIAALEEAVSPGDTVFLYFSGHGVALGAENYLLSVDMPMPGPGGESLVRNEGHAADSLIRSIRAHGAATTFVVLDACRNNPIQSMGKSVGLDKGLARMDAPDGVFVLFAAGIGQTALDRLSDSDPEDTSVFTRKLVPLLKTPGLSHIDLAKRLQVEVSALAASVPHVQEPAYYDQIRGYVVLKEGASLPGPAPPPVAAAFTGSEAERAWAIVKDSEDVASVEAFVRRYGDTFYGDLAKARLDKLKRQQQATLAPAPLPAPKPEAKPEPPAPAPPASTITNMRPGTVFRDCPECPELVVVPAGQFMMGSSATEIAALNDKYNYNFENEGPQHKVTIARPFAVGKYEVTVDEWNGCAAGGACRFKESAGGGRHPVDKVSWDDAKNFVGWLSKKTGKPYRLLSEAEWEYAARAGTTTPFSTGKTITTRQANIAGKGADYRGHTIEVGSFEPNAFGLYDVHGNARELVEDCYKDSYVGAPTDGSAVTLVPCKHIDRGGATNNIPQDVRSASRPSWSAGLSSGAIPNTGFRLARTLGP